MRSKGRECQCDVQGCVLLPLAPLIIPEEWRTRTGMHETCQSPVPRQSAIGKLRHLSKHIEEIIGCLAVNESHF